MRIAVLLLIALLAFQAPAEAQIFEKIKRKVSKKKKEKEEDAIDKGIEEVEGIFKKKKKKKGNDESDDQGSSNDDGPSISSDTSKEEAKEIWMERYDFKPGKEIIFYDDFENEELGEIPSKWKYYKGLMEVIKVNDVKNMVMSGELGYGHPNWEEGVTLPEKFTIEFDIFLPDPTADNRGYGSYSYSLRFYRSDNRKEIATVGIGHGSMALRGIVDGKVPNMKKADYANTWNHISISVNRNSIKGYFNDYRMFNSRMSEAPALIKFWNCCQTTDKPVFLMDNFKIAVGAHPKYKEEILEGRIVTNNIHFETGSSQIIPRSYAEIKRVANVMKAHPDNKFNIEGHTDDRGDDASNLQLSQDRADAVKAALVEMGIPEENLSTVGFGEAIPLEANDTPEGRASNRRVEFVMM